MRIKAPSLGSITFKPQYTEAEKKDQIKNLELRRIQVKAAVDRGFKVTGQHTIKPRMKVTVTGRNLDEVCKKNNGKVLTLEQWDFLEDYCHFLCAKYGTGCKIFGETIGYDEEEYEIHYRKGDLEKIDLEIRYLKGEKLSKGETLRWNNLVTSVKSS